MAAYSIRDALRPPGLVSLTRLPLAVAFGFTAGKPVWATTIIGAAALTDVADGWLARRRHEQTPTGAVLDALMDKVFVLSVAACLLASGAIAIPEALLLGARDIGELPLLTLLAIQRRLTSGAARQANVAGKVATVTQFAAVGALLWGLPHRDVWIFVTAFAGVLAAFSYWIREAHAEAWSPR
jgi:phosphatidylglycerophosphate synthase